MAQGIKITIENGTDRDSYILDDFKKDTVIIGRSKDCDIVVSNERVSGHHGCFYKEKGVWNYQDLKSKNGTLCENTSVTSITVKNGQCLILDKTDKDAAVHVYIQTQVISNLSREKKKEASSRDNNRILTIVAIITSVLIVIFVSAVIVLLVKRGKNKETDPRQALEDTASDHSIQYSISIDRSNLILREEFDLYVLGETFSGFKGTVVDEKKKITDIEYQIVDINSVVVSSGSIESENGSWSIPSPALMMGENTLTVVAKGNDGNEISDSVTVYNGSDAFLENVDVDLSDKDEDGLIAYLETSLGTDDNNPDTDGDGLSDYVEYVQTHTDPALYDTLGDGVCDAERDSDEDGLINREEVKMGSDPGVPDTDGDGIMDGKETAQYNTNPIQPDTDSDGATDGWEVENGYDPLTADDSFVVRAESGALDDSVSIEVTLECDDNPEKLLVEPVSISGVLNENSDCVLGSAYSINYDGEVKELTISMNMPPSVLSSDADPAIYEFDEETQLVTPLETTIQDDSAVAVYDHCAVFVLLDKRLVPDIYHNDILTKTDIDNKTVKIAFVIDYSMSMDDNDPDYTRIEIVKEFLRCLRDGKDEASIIKFAAYATTLVPMSNDIAMSVNALDSIVNNNNQGGGGCESDPEAGTNGGDGLRHGLDEFSMEDPSDKIIVFLTDGEDNRDQYSYDDLTKEAVEKGVRVFTIGLGSIDENQLKNIADNTGGQYYHASEEKALVNVFESIQNETIDYIIDSNEDGISDYYASLIFDGKLTTATGENPFYKADLTKEELIYGDDDFDQDGFKNGEEVIIRESNGAVYLYCVSSPIKKDSDGDGINDHEDLRPLKWDVHDRDLAIFAQLCYRDAEKYVGGMYIISELNQNLLSQGFYTYVQLDGYKPTIHTADASSDTTEQNKNTDSESINSDQELINRWKIIDYFPEDMTAFSHEQFYMTVYKCDDNIVIAYRGTGSVEEEWGEWLDNVLGYGMLNYHSEEVYAKYYAKKIAEAFPDCKLYFTGHSLGGYLAQIGAAEVLNKTSVVPSGIVYFDGMGMNYTDHSGILSIIAKRAYILSNLSGKLFHMDETEALKKYGESGNLKLYRIKGDVVSALGSHYGTVTEYDPTEEYAQDIHAEIKGNGNKVGTVVTSILSQSTSQFNLYHYYELYTDPNGKYKISGTKEYLNLTHRMACLFKHLTR